MLSRHCVPHHRSPPFTAALLPRAQAKPKGAVIALILEQHLPAAAASPAATRAELDPRCSLPISPSCSPAASPAAFSFSLPDLIFSNRESRLGIFWFDGRPISIALLNLSSSPPLPLSSVALPLSPRHLLFLPALPLLPSPAPALSS